MIKYKSLVKNATKLMEEKSAWNTVKVRADSLGSALHMIDLLPNNSWEIYKNKISFLQQLFEWWNVH